MHGFGVLARQVALEECSTGVETGSSLSCVYAGLRDQFELDCSKALPRVSQKALKS